MTDSDTEAEREREEGQKPESSHRQRRFWLRIGLPVVAALIVAGTIWVWVTLGFVYSSTQRTGYVQNLSQSGWLCKTWEGELTANPTPSLTDTTTGAAFAFTIRNDSVARSLQLASGHQVTISYDEHRGVPTSCFGETENYVQRFKIDK